ncbi:MAG: inositol monophosphatase family protein [Shimia sp.]
MTPQLKTDLIASAHAAADAAAAETLRFFRARGLAAENKDAAGFDPVTQADRAAERAIRATLARLRPDDAVLGEEEAATDGTSGLTWVIDPVDGTRAFLCGAPTWGTLIAVQDATGPIYGLIDQPHIGERFEGGLGRAQVGDTPLAVAPRGGLSDAILASTFPEIGSAQEREAFVRVASRVRLVRYGMDCYAYALLAAGHIDLVIEAGLQPYDIAAPIAVIQAAGGIVTTWDGGPAHGGGRIIAAADARLHAEALELLHG